MNNKIAITSTIYSDQDMIYDMLTNKGAIIFDADMYAKYLLTKDDVREDIVKIFRWDPFYSGSIKIEDINAESFVTIMNILKSRILEKYTELMVNRTSPVLFKMDCLYELDYNTYFDKVFFIERNDEMIIKKMVSVGFNNIEASNIVNGAYNVNKKRNLSHHCIKNNNQTRKSLQSLINKTYNMLK